MEKSRILARCYKRGYEEFNVYEELKGFSLYEGLFLRSVTKCHQVSARLVTLRGDLSVVYVVSYVKCQQVSALFIISWKFPQNGWGGIIRAGREVRKSADSADTCRKSL